MGSHAKSAPERARRPRRWRLAAIPAVLATTAGLLALALGGSGAVAATGTLTRAQLTAATLATLPGSTRAVCVNPANGAVDWFEISDVPHQCANNLLTITWATGGSSTTGAPGVGIASAKVNASGDLIITLTNNTTQDAGHVVGANGTNGTNYQPVTASAQTDITKDQDSGNHGNWAVDTLTRQITVTRHGQVAVSNCGGTATNGITSCWYYTALMTDSGSFTTDSGANSPNAGTPINGVLSGTLTGGSSYEFYSSSGSPDGTLVPATLDASTSGTSSSTWPERFFPSGTAFGSVNEINWSYVYNTPTTCETWTDAYNNGDGGQAGDGDITGVNACK